MIVSFQTGSSEDLLTPFKDVLMGLEGDDVTLSCNYSGSVYYLFWYRQNSGSSPQLVISGLSDEKGEKFSLKHKKDKKEFDLVISSAAVTDSAVKYGALYLKISCNRYRSPVTWISVVTGSDYFFWYRQYPGKPPEFLISHSGTGTEILAQVPGLSYKVSDDKKQMDLVISSAAVTDSAVYYCAVRPTVTGNTKTLYKNLWRKDNTILHNFN
ncbi:uncharacterized protein [Leuresthes tenuis]|uniref:uncharacterized protein n=1 Tax=Leuresthes tenuis TaxID=355514 RepID=UPI003B50C790